MIEETKVTEPSEFCRILDMAFVTSKAGDNIYPKLVELVDSKNFDSIGEFEIFVKHETAQWLKLREQEAAPVNSTFRSAMSVIRNALKFEVALYDLTTGEIRGKTAVSNDIKEARDRISPITPSDNLTAFINATKKLSVTITSMRNGTYEVPDMEDAIKQALTIILSAAKGSE